MPTTSRNPLKPHVNNNHNRQPVPVKQVRAQAIHPKDEAYLPRRGLLPRHDPQVRPAPLRLPTSPLSKPTVRPIANHAMKRPALPRRRLQAPRHLSHHPPRRELPQQPARPRPAPPARPFSAPYQLPTRPRLPRHLQDQGLLHGRPGGGCGPLAVHLQAWRGGGGEQLHHPERGDGEPDDCELQWARGDERRGV